MAIMAPTPEQVVTGMMQRSTPGLPLAYPVDTVGQMISSHDLASIMEPSAHGRAGQLRRYWSRSSWASLVDPAGVGHLAPPQTPAGAIGMPFSSPALEFSSFGAGKYAGGEMGFQGQASSVGKCEPGSGAASVQPLLEAVEGVTEASTMVEAIAAHGVEVTAAQEKEMNHSASCSAEQLSGGGGRGGGSPAGANSPAKSSSYDSLAGSRKRKKPPMDKDLSPPDSKAGEVENLKAKRCKGDREDMVKFKGERSSSEASTESGSPKAHKGKIQNKAKEYSKQDYIHVRARRGQATDSHSLAERVRREKISERMKYLQDLVPGCKKVTGKAVMLDEIINYVQSLQRQVEHLSMKLASVNPAQPNLTLDSLVSNKEMLQMHLSSILGSNPEAPGALDVVQMGLSHQGRRLVGGGPCGFDFRSLGNAGLDNIVSSRHTMIPPIASLADQMTMAQHSFNHNVPQSAGWDGELQSVVQMGLSNQGRLGVFEGLHCQMPMGHLKVEF